MFAYVCSITYTFRMWSVDLEHRWVNSCSNRAVKRVCVLSEWGSVNKNGGVEDRERGHRWGEGR